MQKTESRITAIKDKFGTAANFIESFGPRIQRQVALNEKRVFTSKEPLALCIVKQAYGDNIIESLIMAHLQFINEFSNEKNTMMMQQLKATAEIILDNHGDLTLPEFILFASKLKAGAYGDFYGGIKPVKITSALIQFKAYRIRQLNKYEAEIQTENLMRQKEEWAKTAVPPPKDLSIEKILSTITRSG